MSAKNGYGSRRTKGSLIETAARSKPAHNFIESVKVTRPGTGFGGKRSLITAAQSEQDNKSVNSRQSRTNSKFKVGAPLAPAKKLNSKQTDLMRGSQSKVKSKVSPKRVTSKSNAFQTDKAPSRKVKDNLAIGNAYISASKTSKKSDSIGLKG